jgi:hypothetical protein
MSGIRRMAHPAADPTLGLCPVQAPRLGRITHDGSARVGSRQRPRPGHRPCREGLNAQHRLYRDLRAPRPAAAPHWRSASSSSSPTSTRSPTARPDPASTCTCGSPRSAPSPRTDPSACSSALDCSPPGRQPPPADHIGALVLGMLAAQCFRLRHHNAADSPAANGRWTTGHVLRSIDGPVSICRVWDAGSRAVGT